MTTPRAFRAVSLDLWYTTIAPGPGDERRWKDARVRVLESHTTNADGSTIDRHRIDETLTHLMADLESGGRMLETIDAKTVVEEMVERLHAQWKVSADETARAYSAAGLSEHPPRINPEATALAKHLHGIGVPVISITNTARREASWQEMFLAHRGPRFERIVASCEVGRAKPDPEIFLEAARRIGLDPQEILHVGDRWDLDVEGALRSGFGAVLYRGLWPLYPEGLVPDVRDHADTGADSRSSTAVVRVDRLDEILNPDRFVWPSSASRSEASPTRV